MYANRSELRSCGNASARVEVSVSGPRPRRWMRRRRRSSPVQAARRPSSLSPGQAQVLVAHEAAYAAAAIFFLREGLYFFNSLTDRRIFQSRDALGSRLVMCAHFTGSRYGCCWFSTSSSTPHTARSSGASSPGLLGHSWLCRPPSPRSSGLCATSSSTMRSRRRPSNATRKSKLEIILRMAKAGQLTTQRAGAETIRKRGRTCDRLAHKYKSRRRILAWQWIWTFRSLKTFASSFRTGWLSSLEVHG